MKDLNILSVIAVMVILSPAVAPASPAPASAACQEQLALRVSHLQNVALTAAQRVTVELKSGTWSGVTGLILKVDGQDYAAFDRDNGNDLPIAFVDAQGRSHDTASGFDWTAKRIREIANGAMIQKSGLRLDPSKLTAVKGSWGSCYLNGYSIAAMVTAESVVITPGEPSDPDTEKPVPSLENHDYSPASKEVPGMTLSPDGDR